MDPTRCSAPKLETHPSHTVPYGGIYALRIRLSYPVHLTVGALPLRRYDPGTYWYVGSAQKNLRSRLSRHLKADKPLRWHIDYFLATPQTRIESVLTKPADKSLECEAARLVSLHGDPIPRFGASDCRCPAHLLHTRENTARAAEKLLLERGFVRTPTLLSKPAANPDRNSPS
jgi:Uri superfamily endonuclease